MIIFFCHDNSDPHLLHVVWLHVLLVVHGGVLRVVLDDDRLVVLGRGRRVLHLVALRGVQPLDQSEVSINAISQSQLSITSDCVLSLPAFSQSRGSESLTPRLFIVLSKMPEIMA